MGPVVGFGEASIAEGGTGGGHTGRGSGSATAAVPKIASATATAAEVRGAVRAGLAEGIFLARLRARSDAALPKVVTPEATRDQVCRYWPLFSSTLTSEAVGTEVPRTGGPPVLGLAPFRAD